MSINLYSVPMLRFIFSGLEIYILFLIIFIHTVCMVAATEILLLDNVASTIISCTGYLFYEERGFLRCTSAVSIIFT